MKCIAYTDGACSGNPGPGGWGVVLQAKNGDRIAKTKELYGSERDSTNNRMELTAAIEALSALSRPTEIRIYSDSKYVVDGIRMWIKGWKARNWTTKGRKPVANKELWLELDRLCNIHAVTWIWVKGHAANEGNIQADKLACRGRDEAKLMIPLQVIDEEDTADA